MDGVGPQKKNMDGVMQFLTVLLQFSTAAAYI
jgi:hypothetical protein